MARILDYASPQKQRHRLLPQRGQRLEATAYAAGAMAMLCFVVPFVLLSFVDALILAMLLWAASGTFGLIGLLAGIVTSVRQGWTRGLVVLTLMSSIPVAAVLVVLVARWLADTLRGY